MSVLIPSHVAIIMDGNGRWAERRGKPRFFGHVRGCSTVREIIRESDRLGLKALTLYAFSSENWKRPKEEVFLLMKLLKKWLIRERKEILEKNIKFRAIGSLEKLPEWVRSLVLETMEISKHHTGLQVTLALSYGSRDEIINTTKTFAEKVKSGALSLDEITEEMFSEQLSTFEMGDPDLLIRTSGEHRISNFLLWQLAYSEFYFTDLFWPEFTPSEFRKAIDAFGRRERRFGLTSNQVAQSNIVHL